MNPSGGRLFRKYEYQLNVRAQDRERTVAWCLRDVRGVSTGFNITGIIAPTSAACYWIMVHVR